MEQHDAAVLAIAKEVAQFYERKQGFRIYHGTTNSTRKQAFSRNQVIDTSNLSNVLNVDVTTNTVTVEPNVPMDQLVTATLRHGLIPPVVMEFPGITVGGGFSGTAGESSSFKHGLFEQNIIRIEIILANGRVLNASQTENPDLLDGAAGAFGTLGVITMLEVKLIPATTFVELNCIPAPSASAAVQSILSLTQNSESDFVDGIMFTKDHAVIMQGRMTNDAGSKNIVRFTRARDPWFYLHVKDVIGASPESKTIVTPLVDYLFRYDRGGFWMASYSFDYFLTPFNGLTRLLLDPLMRTRVMYHALHKSNLAERYLVQDCVVPASNAEELLNFCDHEVGIYPLWLCPLRNGVSAHGHLSAVRPKSKIDSNIVINVGIWGPTTRAKTDSVALNRDLEAEVRRLGGIKTLYAQSYYTKEEFESIYPQKRYQQLRQKYCATTLPTVYEKVRVQVPEKTPLADRVKRIRPLGGIYGVLCAILGKDYMIARDSHRTFIVMFGVFLGVVSMLLFDFIPF